MGTRALATAFLGGMLTLPSMCNVYKSDITKLCDAELLSQVTLKTNRTQLFTWMERNVASSEAVIFVGQIEAKDAHGISAALHEEARKASLPSCTFADQAELQAKEEDFRTDLTNLCAGSAAKSDGSIARLDVAAADDAERMREILEWVGTNAKSADTLPLVQKIGALPPRQRGTALRAEAGKVAATSCPMSLTLDAPPPPPPPPVEPRKADPSFVLLKVDGSAKNQLTVAQGLIGKDAAQAINNCYAQGLTTTATLAGKVTLKLQIDPTGRITSAANDASALKGPVVACIGGALSGMALGAPLPDGGKKGAKASVTLDLEPAAGGSGFSAAIDPGFLSKLAAKHK